jgi:threonine/homoserine/homoserine lactone efflux protein
MSLWVHYLLPANPVDKRRSGKTMYEIVSMLVLGFVIGLTGALAPGPTLVATINASLAGSWTAGLKISLGHILIESAIFLLIVLGLSSIASPYTAVIGGVGGIALIVFGIMTIQGSRTASLTTPGTGSAANPYMAGFLTSAANPYFWIWWLSVGSAMVIAGLQGGIFLAVVFMIGHWGADTGWFTLVSTSVSRGKTILSDTAYHRVMAGCGIFLILFGVYFLSGVVVPR